MSLSPIWPEAQRKTRSSRGKRPVNGVHCLSRAFMRLSYKRPLPSPYVYGGVAGEKTSRSRGSGTEHPSKVSASRQVLSVHT